MPGFCWWLEGYGPNVKWVTIGEAQFEPCHLYQLDDRVTFDCIFVCVCVCVSLSQTQYRSLCICYCSV